ncbi:MAG: ferredoxin reductase family protein [Thermodesulfobacteriota bacterium]
MGALLAILYALVALSPLIFVALLRMKGEMTLMHEVATSLALAAYAIMALQPVLASRWKWIERPFGFDVVIRLHRYMGAFVVLLLLCHPPGMAFGGAGMGLLTNIIQPWNVWVGRVVLILLILQVVISVGYARFGMTFEQWRRSHNFLAVLILTGAFIHSWWTAYDLGPIAMQLLWLALFGLTIFAYVHHKVLKPRCLARRAYRVVGVEPETHNVWTVKFAPPAGERIYEYQPGQFHFITLQRLGGLPVEEHHWTISSSPTNKDFISSTIKESGDFTSTIGKTNVGDTALLQGPFGRFCYTLYPEDKDFVFIAGGIGITPLMSMIRHMRGTSKDANVLLIYANRTEKDIAFRDELAQIESGSSPRLKVIHIVSSPESGWTGESGHLDRDKLVQLLGRQGEQTAYYICAPPGLAKIVIESLRSIGVPYARMRTEEFML